MTTKKEFIKQQMFEMHRLREKDRRHLRAVQM